MQTSLRSLGRERFVKLCGALLKAEYPALEAFSAPDKGMDAYDPDSRTIFQFYFPDQHARKYKVTADLKKAGKQPRPCTKWVLLLPFDPTPGFLDWVRDMQGPQYSFAIAVWGETEIGSRLRRHPTVSKQFFRTDGDDDSLRHLQDIKARVIRPIKQWLDSSVVPALKGNAYVVSFGRVAKPRTGVALGESSTEISSEFVAALAPDPAVDTALLQDARGTHFPEEFSALEELKARIAQFVPDVATFTRAAAGRMASATPLPRGTGWSQDAEFADSDDLACLLLRDLLANRQTDFLFYPGPTLNELRTHSGEPFARGGKEAVTGWYKAGQEIIRKAWEESDLSKRLPDILRQATAVSGMFNELELTYDLRGDCRFVCG